ncbi:Homoserine dehydrogenase Hom [Helicobacter sp. NHP21005]|uniref:homoserine dehydrogenase n=1 Tax=Helicobacter felistomachi TaxID=3040201 RepID=UPI00257389B6|nr:homoserine dehydrogenase [Helicobacter sp. NHP21005]BEG56666.1 Homoserine dehydrogenase Hom [Helicobacter sp. NHP21005]
MLQIGIVGLGCVGLSVVEILNKHADLLVQRCGHQLMIKKGVVKDLSKKRPVDFALSTDINTLLDDPDINLIVELSGQVELAYKLATKALKRGKGFITANKAMLAQHQELIHSPIGFEASVGGGIPLIKALKEGLASNAILGIQGVINGTCNFILEQMDLGQSFENALKKAQDLGYAEANAHLDTSGQDSAHKLLILSSLAFGGQIAFEGVAVQGIEGISNTDLMHAKRLGYRLKLLAQAHKSAEGLTLSVGPVLLPQEHMLAQVQGVMNGAVFVGDSVGETFYYGAGAGGLATASAVVSDILDFCRQKHALKLKTLPTIALAKKAPKPHYVRLGRPMPKNIPATLHFCAGQEHIYTTQPTHTQELQASLAHLGAQVQIYPLLA